MDTLISCPVCAILFRRDSYLRRTHLESRRSWRDRMLEFNDFFPLRGEIQLSAWTKLCMSPLRAYGTGRLIVGLFQSSFLQWNTFEGLHENAFAAPEHGGR